LGAVALLVLVLLNLPPESTARLKLAVGSLFLPLFGLANTTQRAADDATRIVVPRGELVRENERLEKENEAMKVLQVQAEAIQRENERLRKLLDWQKQATWRVRLARVVLREPANWWHTVQIDLGSRDGIRKDLTVMTTEGLVGRISEVGFARSQVVLLGDPECRVSVLVQETRDMGVIEGGAAGPLDTKLIEVSHLPGSSKLVPGQTVLTSGEGGIFPKGIPVGQIMDFRPVQFGLYTEARVKIAANLSSLEEVWVVMP
jgi:rod shape-determining protein MreC